MILGLLDRIICADPDPSFKSKKKFEIIRTTLISTIV
jgi:hypothetical protein